MHRHDKCHEGRRLAVTPGCFDRTQGPMGRRSDGIAGDLMAARQDTVHGSENVLARVDGRVGHLTLNRPERINALSLSMVRATSAALAGWEHDPDVDAVLIDGAGPRALLA